MNINLHIERLVLDGLPIGSGQGQQVRHALERELASLLAAGGAGAIHSGGLLHRVQAPGMALQADVRPAQLGGQIAGAIYGALRK